MEPYRLPRSIEERLKARARRTGRSITAVAREAVLDGIEALEDYYLAVALAREQQRECAAGPASTR